MKICIINSPLFREKNLLYDEDSLPPIGLGLIASALKQAGHHAELIDAVALNIPIEELITYVNKCGADVICMNVFSTNLSLVRELIERIDISTHIVLGGLATGSLFEEIANWKTTNKIDLVHGDGERVILDLINGAVTETPKRQAGFKRLFSIDSSSQYYVSDISEQVLDRSFFVNEPTIHPLGFTEANIVTSRGCIYNCTFCAAARSLNKEFGVRERDSVHVRNEIEYLKRLYPGIQSIRVLDDLFLKNESSVQKAIEVFDGLDLQWRSMAHVQTFRNVDNNTIRHLARSGCSELFIGIESGSPKILKSIYKTHDVEVIKKNLAVLLRNGINIKGYFIYGFPNETVEDFEMTYQLALYLKEVSLQHGSKFRTSVFQYRPYHGTEIFHELTKSVAPKSISDLTQVEPNSELSEMVGRLQFNFHSGNYSASTIEQVNAYIYKTTNLTDSNTLPPHEWGSIASQRHQELLKLSSLQQPTSAP